MNSKIESKQMWAFVKYWQQLKHNNQENTSKMPF